MIMYDDKIIVNGWVRRNNQNQRGKLGSMMRGELEEEKLKMIGNFLFSHFASWTCFNPKQSFFHSLLPSPHQIYYFLIAAINYYSTSAAFLSKHQTKRTLY